MIHLIRKLMKLNILLFVGVLLFTCRLSAQTLISGVVTDTANVPIPFARVFLSQTTIGTLANLNGEYSLTVPKGGNYELVVTSIGFVPYSQYLSAIKGKEKINIKLNVQVYALGQVTVKAKDLNRLRNYRQFVESFIGNTFNSSFCKIENPDDIIVFRGPKDSILSAYSTNPIIIENKGLGYHLFYELEDFHRNLKSGHIQYSGHCYFQEFEGSSSQKAKWQLARLLTYYGSKMHFLRAVYNDSLKENNFVIYESAKVSRNIKIYGEFVDISVFYRNFNQGTVQLYSDSVISINYTLSIPELNFATHSQKTKIFSRSRISFSDTLQVYKNGQYFGPYDAIWKGDMGDDRVAEMLPYDFIPLLPVNEK